MSGRFLIIFTKQKAGRVDVTEAHHRGVVSSVIILTGSSPSDRHGVAVLATVDCQYPTKSERKNDLRGGSTLAHGAHISGVRRNLVVGSASRARHRLRGQHIVIDMVVIGLTNL